MFIVQHKVHWGWVEKSKGVMVSNMVAKARQGVDSSQLPSSILDKAVTFSESQFADV